MSKYFYHGIYGFYHAIPRFLKVFQTGGIKCRRLLGRAASNGYNGMDYVSICRKEAEEAYKETDMDNAFYNFVQNRFCFIISDDIEAIKTKPAGEVLWYEYTDSQLADKKERISDMFDEWQVYKEIPLSSIIGIGIPMSLIRINQPTGGMLETLKQILEISNALGLDIIDTSQAGFVEEYEKKKQNGYSKVYQLTKPFEEMIQ